MAHGTAQMDEMKKIAVCDITCFMVWILGKVFPVELELVAREIFFIILILRKER